MTIKRIKILFILLLTTHFGCSQPSENHKDNQLNYQQKDDTEFAKKTHRYGGWYCPDNIFGFPAIDFSNWNTVPVIRNRFPSREETQTQASLIFVDTLEYPNSGILDLNLPKLAQHYNRHTNRNEYVILIQAFRINNDSIVGFRYLNGGNGSAHLSEVTLLKETEIANIYEFKFVSIELKIKGTVEKVWKVMTDKNYSNTFTSIKEKEYNFPENWRDSTNFNYYYANSGKSLSRFAQKHFGNFYLQNDYAHLNYSEKITLKSNISDGSCTVKVVFGPFLSDVDSQRKTIINWIETVKFVSEITKF